jgi:hypothetical protein
MWYAGALVSTLLGVSPALGPILGTAAAALVGGDPRRLIWSGSGAPSGAAPAAAISAANPA